MKLIDIEQKRQLQREEAAHWLRTLADDLARHNDLEFERDGLPYKVVVPDEITMEIELEIGDKGSSLEIELSW